MVLRNPEVFSVTWDYNTEEEVLREGLVGGEIIPTNKTKDCEPTK